MVADINYLLNFFSCWTLNIHSTYFSRSNFAQWTGIGETGHRYSTKESLVLIVTVEVVKCGHLNESEDRHEEVNIFKTLDHLKEAIDSETVMNE